MKHFAITCAALLVSIVSASAQTQGLLIENVTLIDGTGASPVTGAFIWIEGDRIRGVSDEPIEVPRGTTRLKGKGKYAIPGLMDMHVHIRGPGSGFDGAGPGASPAAFGLSAIQGYLYAGVTTIYDAGNDQDYIFSFREQERSGEIVAPRIFATGYIVTAPNGHGSNYPITIGIEDWPADRDKLDAHIAAKPDILKITQDEHGWGTRPMINKLPLDLLETIIRYYHEHGIRTTIHASNELRTWEAIYAGIDTLVHPVIQAPVSDKYLNMMKVKRIPQVTTLAIGESYSRLAEDPNHLDQPLYRATLDPEEIRRLKEFEAQKQAERRWAAWMKVMTPVAQDNVKRVNKVGGVVVLGTDQSLAAAVHRELELLVEGGIPALDAIKIASLNGARFLGKEADLGSVEKGKIADLVLLTADPIADIKNTTRIDTVIKGGRIIDRSNLQIPANATGTQ